MASVWLGRSHTGSPCFHCSPSCSFGFLDRMQNKRNSRLGSVGGNEEVRACMGKEGADAKAGRILAWPSDDQMWQDSGVGSGC